MMVDVGTILGLALRIPEGEQYRLVNSRIDLRIFNEVYGGIEYGGYGVSIPVLARNCHDTKHPLANCGEEVKNASPQFARWRLAGAST